MMKNEKWLVPSYLTNTLYPYILDKEKSSVSFGIKLTNINELITNERINQNDAIIFNHIYDNLQVKKKSLKHYKKILEYPAFVVSLLQFSQELAFYQIELDELPQNTEEEKEIYRILKWIEEVDNYRDIAKNILEKDLNLKKLNGFYDNYFNYYLINKIKGEKIELEEPSSQDVLFFQTTTRSKEINGVAKYLVSHQKEIDIKKVQIVVPNDTYMLDLQRIFDGYHLPYQFISYNQEVDSLKHLKAIIEYYFDDSNTNFYKVIRCGFMKETMEYADDLVAYLEFFGCDKEECLNDFNRLKNSDGKIKEIISEKDIDALKDLEAKAEEQRKKYLDKIKRIVNKEDIYEVLKDTYNQEKKLLVGKDKKEVNAFIKARDLISSLGIEKGNIKVLHFLINQIKKKVNNKYEGIKIVDMNHLLPGNDLTIVLGASESDFLSGNRKTGCISEEYVAQIKKYPTLEKRLEFIELKAKSLKKISPKLIVSYSCSSLTGDEQKLSNYIEDIFGVTEKDFSQWQDDEYNFKYQTKDTIDKNYVEKIFVKDGYLSGSVSALEKYQGCHYQYFLDVGLKIKKAAGIGGIDATLMGNLRHKVFENMHNDNNISVEKMNSEIDEMIDALEEVYRKEKNSLEIKKALLKEFLSLYVKLNNTMMETSKYKTTISEEQLNGYEVKTSTKPFKFTAKVDRIDMDDNCFRVIDYKSSNHKFSNKEFEKGEQLQLLTYLWLLARKKYQDKAAVGAYYFGLNIKDSENKKPDKLKKKIDLFTAKEDECFDAFCQNNLPSGVTLNQGVADEAYLQTDWFKSTKVGKNEKYDRTTIDGIEEALFDIYSTIAQNILDGKLFRTSEDGSACKFCDLRSICRKKKVEEEDV